MRGLNGKRINREPVRSPSPDIANRNAIVHTTPPHMQEILHHSHKKLNHSPSFSLSHEELQRSLTNAEQRYRQLELQLNALLLENSSMKKEMADLKDRLARTKTGLATSSSQNVEISLRDYESRIGKFADENRRIQELLVREKEKNEQLQKENNGLRRSQVKAPEWQYRSDTTEQYLNSSRAKQPQELSNSRLQFVQNELNSSFDRMRTEYQLKMHLSLNAISERLARAERSQSSIQALFQNEMTPPRRSEPKQYQYSTEARRTVSPSDPKRFVRKGQDADRQSEEMRDKLRQSQMDQDGLRRQLDKLGRQNDSLRDRLRSSNLDSDKQGREIQALRRQGETLRIQLQLQRDKSNRLREAECQKCKNYILKIQELQRQLQRQRQSKIKADQERQALARQQFSLRQELQRYGQRIEGDLQDYLKRIKDIKALLQNQQFRQFVFRVNQLINENSSLNDKLDHSIKERERQQRDARGREIQLRVQINELQRVNQVLKTQVKEQEVQLQKTQEIIDQFSKPEPEISQFQSRYHRVESTNDSKIFQNYIQEAIRKLQNLQESIGHTLHN